MEIKFNSGQVSLITITPDAEKLIAYCARVSSKNQENPKIEKLLRYCLKHGHWSIFEQASMTVEIQCPLAIAIQILRHRSFCFQQFCLSGDSVVSFDLPGALDKNKRQLYKLTLKQLWEKWNKHEHHRNQIKNMNIRIYDENSKEIINSHIKEVFQTGIKPIYQITLANGKSIKTTKEHKFLTPDGFQTLEDAIGLKLYNNKALMNKKNSFACNGIPVYQNYDWMKVEKEKAIQTGLGVQGIADAAGVSYHTIRKWLKIHNLSFTGKERSQRLLRRKTTEPALTVGKYTKIWNRGKSGYSWGKHTPETREIMRQKAKKGKDNPLWRGGVDRDWRIKVQDELNRYRCDFLAKYDYQCNRCGSNINLELHHIVPIFENPELALSHNNIEVLCQVCHQKHHNTLGHKKTWRKKSKGNKLSVSYSEVVKVEYLGEEMTYDLEIDHSSHNYVANQMVVHNSKRYQEVEKENFAYLPEIRLQDYKNRQNSIIPDNDELQDKYNHKIEKLYDDIFNLYKEMIDDGVAKECARFVLPEAVMTKLYMTGNIRSFIHYLQVRTSNDAQKEHREVADAIGEILKKECPIIWNAAFDGV